MLTGFYYDPLHGGCLRRVKRLGKDTYLIVGVYGDDERPHTHGRWTATIKRVGSDVLHVDFHGKPTKADRHMTATFDARVIKWSDGNVWRRLFVHGDQLTKSPRSTRWEHRGRSF